MKDYSKYIGYVLFVVTIIAWIFTAGITFGKIKETAKTVEELHQMMIEQKELNGKIIMYIELNEKN